ncbi:hypothetical protein [Micromonospora sp. WMMD980]|uniref:hypothetical protein n=1 Tax=Micromonospora sp. WMMD980 TaxID=3016088 RepID=UPI002415EDA5|nr:hypothetical protein [Micromonospora sp. WMMD980]MDG4804940.1 hypothetical protein [Micromonospora sp. WMMD980]
MAVGAEDLIRLLRLITSVHAGEREAGAENASDWAAAFDREEAESVALVLANMASLEGDARVREAQLHAILGISDVHTLRAGLVNSIHQLNGDKLSEEQSSYLDELGLGTGKLTDPPA